MVHQLVPAIGRLGVTVEDLAPGTVDLRVPITGNANHMGTMYAGALFALLELPGGLLPLSLLGSRYTPIVIEIQVRYLAAARTDVTLTARMDPDQLRALAARADEHGEAAFTLELHGVDSQGATVVASTAHYLLRPTRT